MWTISNLVCFFILVVLSLKDIQTHQVSVPALAASASAGVIYHLVSREMDAILILGGILVGVLFLGLSKVTGEGIGYGDSVGILVLGSYLGIWGILVVTAIAFLLLACVVIPVLWTKKMSRKCAIPFYPFLTLGYVGMILMGGVQA